MKFMPKFLSQTVYRFATAKALVLIMASLLLGPSFVQSAEGSATFSNENELMKISNAYYEVALNTTNGGITSILDKRSNKNIIQGSEASNLWSAVLDKGAPILSSSYADFSSEWDSPSSTLTLTYSAPIGVKVKLTASDSPSLSIQASVMNSSDANITSFVLPDSLRIAESEVDSALMPMMPGAKISSQFFTDGRTYINEYPGVMFADYLAVNSRQGKLAVYAKRAAVFQPALIGFEHLKDDAGYTKLTHKYRTWIGVGKSWLSPEVVVTVGQDYPITIQNYRTDNHIDQFKSLTDKLGSAAPTYFASPMYKLDMAVLKIKFTDIQEKIIDKVNIPGMIHLVAFQTGGHDHNYPDLVPPDKKWGMTTDFTDVVKNIHDEGGLVVPYTNFSWWNNNSPTLSKLPADTPLNSLVNIKDTHGLPGFETYGPNSGFVMNIHNVFVQNKITQQHQALLKDIGVDGIFEDQWGARSAPYDYNPAGLEAFDPSTSYFEGVLQHYRDHSDSKLMTESGVDMLADNGVGFMGTNYLWDMLGYRSDTAGVTSYYPMAGMMLRDKVLLYQHDLAAETWTNNKEMLRWNLAQGYSLSNAFLDSKLPGLNMDNPWLNLVGVFQKYALANYADQLVTNFDDLGNNVWQTTFSTYKVYSNWDAEQSFTVGGYTLPPGGVVTQANAGSVTAGVFTAYNGSPLKAGDHYLVELRSETAIKLFQPVGEDTAISIRKEASWDKVKVTAYSYDGQSLDDIPAGNVSGNVNFTYYGTINGTTVGYYQISPVN